MMAGKTLTHLMTKNRLPVIAPNALTGSPMCSDDLVPYIEAIKIVGRATIENWKDGYLEAKILHTPVEPDLHQPFPERKPDTHSLVQVDGVEKMERVLPTVIGSTPSGRAHSQKVADDWLKRKQKWDDQKQSRFQEEQGHFEKYTEEFEANETAYLALIEAHDKLSRAILSERVSLFWYYNYKKVSGPPAIFAQGNHRNQAIQTGSLVLGGGDKTPIFLDKEELAFAFPNAPDVIVDGIKSADLSDYMQVALALHKEGFGKDFKGSKKEVLRALDKQAKIVGIAISENLRQALATMVRNTDAQAGKSG